MLSPTDLPLCVCVCVCVIKGMTDSLSELNTGSKLHSNHTVNNNEKLICSTHTHTHTHADILRQYACSFHMGALHNRLIFTTQ